MSVRRALINRPIIWILGYFEVHSSRQRAAASSVPWMNAWSGWTPATGTQPVWHLNPIVVLQRASQGGYLVVLVQVEASTSCIFCDGRVPYLTVLSRYTRPLRLFSPPISVETTYGAIGRRYAAREGQRDLDAAERGGHCSAVSGHPAVSAPQNMQSNI